MKNVMWRGELAGRIQLDTMTDKKGLYGLGPLSYLQGEITVNDGRCYVSRVNPDGSMTVTEDPTVSAPFFVYAHVTNWDTLVLPKAVRTIADLEKYVDEQSRHRTRPFAFKLAGRVAGAVIHVQNLPPGTQVSSPEEAHQGQVDYKIGPTEAEIVGFFSTEHHGVFTHHDANTHLHLITADATKMGHLDHLEINQMTLFLPRE